MEIGVNKKMLFYIFIAFLFSIGVRMIWVYQFNSVDDFFWNNQLMINTNDGYFYAEGARDALKGSHEANDLSPINDAVSILTAFFAKILPFSFESVILYMPSFLGSLVVVPIILIAKRVKNLEMGLIAALLASIAWSYYNRTMVGYYDTDMLNIVFPMFILYFAIIAIEESSINFAFIGALFIVGANWWYKSSSPLIFAFCMVLLIYALLSTFITSKARAKTEPCEHLQKCKDLGLINENSIFLYKLLTLFFVANSRINEMIIVGILILVYMFFLRKEQDNKIIYTLFGLSIILFLSGGGLGTLVARLSDYVARESVDGVELFFFTSHQTVMEASAIPFDLFTNRISGNIITFFLSLIGYGYLCYRHKIMLLSLPMFFLGCLAYKSGLRFTIYAVPLMALGVAYLLVKIADIIENKAAKVSFLAFSTALILIPNIFHAKDYLVPTVFNKSEVKAVDYLKKHASREDYILSWWDYGYPLRYYADAKTLVDGGASKSPNHLFETSFVLNADQKSAANMARLAVEYREKGFNAKKDEKLPSSEVAWMMQDYGFKSPDKFLASLQNDIKLPKKTRDIYLYLPYRMTSIFPTIGMFCYRDLATGKNRKSPFFYAASTVKDVGDKVLLGNGVSLNKKNNTLNIGSNVVPIKHFYIIDFDKNNNPIVKQNSENTSGQLNIIYARPYGSFFVVDDKILNSTFFQLFFLENYDKNLYELVDSNPYAKIYKLKR